MAITIEDLDEAISRIASVNGITMTPARLLEDVIALAKLFPSEERFRTAVQETVLALGMLATGKKEGKPLERNHEGIFSYHYQSIRVNGQEADLRVAYEPEIGFLFIWQFGHRWIPADATFYARLDTRKQEDARET